MDIHSNDHTILIVENNQYGVEILLNILNQLDFRLVAAGTGEKAIALCKEIAPDLILMDVQMPGMDGFDTAALLKKDKKTQHIPILFTSTFSDSANILRCFESGGVDYISKPFKKEELLARINTHLSLTNLRKQLQAERDNLSAILQNMLPDSLLNTLKSGSFPRPMSVNSAGVLFTDFKNFSKLSQLLGSRESVTHLNLLYFGFDEIIDSFGLERVKTIGDAYFAVGGINTQPDDLYLSPALAALKLLEFVNYYNNSQKNEHWQLRIGITVGPVTSGVIGYQKIAYDVWGDSVNLANHLEEESDVGHVAIPDPVYQKIRKYITSTHTSTFSSEAWGQMTVHHCNNLTDALPAKFRNKFQETSPKTILKKASSREHLLNKIFRLNTEQN
ncbi:MAG: adenylate/guanylate cyclase domain-containing protein [Balneolales bacterium]